MRSFWLTKGLDVWDISSAEFTANRNFMAQPQGLGLTAKIDSFEVERSTFVESVKIEPAEITGELLFADYAQFIRFAEFIGHVELKETIRFYYSTTSKPTDLLLNTEWYREVLIKELTKGEIDEYGVLRCEVKFLAVSRWKRDQTITLELAPFGQPLTYPFFYPYHYGGANHVAVSIDNRGNLPTHCKVIISAETHTPTFRVLQNGEVVEQARYHVIIRPGSHMVVNSDPAMQEASLYTAGHREDVYHLGERDYSYSNFITIPSGQSMFLFSANNNIFGAVRLEYSLQRELI